MILARDQILSADDLPRQPVDCPEWGGVVHVRCLSLAERLDQLRPLLATEGDVTAEMVALCACDEGGANLFAADDVAALRRKNRDILVRIAEAALAINGLTEKATEAAEKN